jgi:intracellular multiplication protein IcmO
MAKIVKTKNDLQDLKDQREGEAHIFFKSKIIRATMFFANPRPAPEMRVNQFLKVEPPLNRVLSELDERVERLQELLSGGVEIFEGVKDDGDDILVISDAIAAGSDQNPIERSLNALMAFHNRHAVAEPESQEAEAVADGHLNIFSSVPLDDFVKTLVGSSEITAFSQPLLNRAAIRDKVGLMERLLGRASSQAGPMTTEILKDMTIATDYPPVIEGILLPEEEVVTLANELCDYVTSLKDKSQEEGL